MKRNAGRKDAAHGIILIWDNAIIIDLIIFNTSNRHRDLIDD